MFFDLNLRVEKRKTTLWSNWAWPWSRQSCKRFPNDFWFPERKLYQKHRSLLRNVANQRHRSEMTFLLHFRSQHKKLLIFKEFYITLEISFHSRICKSCMWVMRSITSRAIYSCSIEVTQFSSVVHISYVKVGPSLTYHCNLFQ